MKNYAAARYPLVAFPLFAKATEAGSSAVLFRENLDTPSRRPNSSS
jgi:hypothetical protein